MHTSALLSFVRALPMGLCALSIIACGPSDSSDDVPRRDVPTGLHGNLQVEYNGEWEAYDPLGQRFDTLGRRFPSDVHRFALGGFTSVRVSSSGPGTTDALVFDLHLDKTVLGSGPTTLVIDGQIGVSVAGNDNLPPPTFVPRGSHSARVQRAWVRASCGGEIYFEETAQQDIKGSIEFRLNTLERVSGRLVIEMSGQAAGPCPIRQARADLEFDVVPSEDHNP
ncbi:hypothetical protein [Myxococcus hansupus]|uniref:hypothetical protein n=1 Tax=Pseudomyxococcus hansupus TaxID=1297742 RepID=UPI0011876EAD|nr:hypothetical protein [Myxococcus hansupus]